MKKQPICEECEHKFSYSGSNIEISYAKQERENLLKKVKETLDNIKFYHNTSNSLKKQNAELLSDVQSMKTLIKEHRVKEHNENLLNEKNYSELVENNKALEDKLVKLKIEYATKAEEVEEIKDTIQKISDNIKVKDAEIMRLNKELEKMNLSISESDEANKPSMSFGSPKKPVFLQRKKIE